MRIFVVGANGRTGREIVASALADRHQVTAFVRQTRGLPPAPTAGLRVVTGNVVTEQDRLTAALAGHDVVISALGNGLRPRDGRAPKILAAADATLRHSELDWTVAHFGALTDQHSTGAVITTSLTRPRGYRIPRIDVASALVRLATEENRARTQVVLDGATEAGAGRELVPPTRRPPIPST